MALLGGRQVRVGNKIKRLRTSREFRHRGTNLDVSHAQFWFLLPYNVEETRVMRSGKTARGKILPMTKRTFRKPINGGWVSCGRWVP